jgi:hypothetical protein
LGVREEMREVVGVGLSTVVPLRAQVLDLAVGPRHSTQLRKKNEKVFDPE